MQWVQFLETLRRTGDPYIMRRVNRLYLTRPTSGFRYRFATRDATFVPIATDILMGCTNANHLTVTYHPHLMPIIDASRRLENISSLSIIGSNLFNAGFFGQEALAQIFLNPAHPSSFPSVTSLTIVKCSYDPGSYNNRLRRHHTLHLQSLRIIDAELCGATFTFLLQPCITTLTTLVLTFTGQPGHHINGRTFKEELQSLTHLRHLAIIGWSEDGHPYECPRPDGRRGYPSPAAQHALFWFPSRYTSSFHCHDAARQTMEAAQHPRAYPHYPTPVATLSRL